MRPSRNEAAAPVGPNCHDLEPFSSLALNARDADNVFGIVFTSAVPLSLNMFQEDLTADARAILTESIRRGGRMLAAI